MIIMYKKRKIEIMIDFELHAPNLLSAFIVKLLSFFSKLNLVEHIPIYRNLSRLVKHNINNLCTVNAQLNKSNNYSLKF